MVVSVNPKQPSKKKRRISKASKLIYGRTSLVLASFSPVSHDSNVNANEEVLEEIEELFVPPTINIETASDPTPMASHTPSSIPPPSHTPSSIPPPSHTSSFIPPPSHTPSSIPTTTDFSFFDSFDYEYGMPDEGMWPNNDLLHEIKNKLDQMEKCMMKHQSEALERFQKLESMLIQPQLPQVETNVRPYQKDRISTCNKHQPQGDH